MIEKIHKTPCGNIHYWINIIDKNAVTLIFLPGLTADHRLFDKQIQYLGYDIEIHYEDITAYIKIKKDENMYLHSCLIWDDIENVVVDYTYLNN